MDFKMDIRLMITILIITTGLGGFYYTTQLRLDTIEVALEEPTHDCHVLKNQMQNLLKRIKRLENK
jgi:uncharacterized protein YoxC